MSMIVCLQLRFEAAVVIAQTVLADDYMSLQIATISEFCSVVAWFCTFCT